MKMIKVVLILSVVAGLFGCDIGSSPSKIDSSNVLPNMTICAKNWDNVRFSYAVDENSDVVYILFDGYYSGGIAVAYNADGTIMKRADLEKMKNND